ncbi:C40 family peptidase [Salisaeta longa]|uniref:C40 family peptidase n=1 Tax=Salisaeta longa TaxID=503170 RepID=UPI000685733B|nr:NlpC/P60 family protein [Salisaeta longa]
MRSPLHASWLIGIAAMLLLAGCSSSRPATYTSSAAGASTAERSLRRAAAEWAGVPHRWGGESKRGVDCSGLTLRLYERVYGLQLPRTTEQQASVGQRVNRLQTGDLVFFKTGAKSRHVGVYISNGEFVHASSSSGVRISRLSNPYWQEHYWMSRRIVRSTANRAATRRSSATPTPASRSGW